MQDQVFEKFLNSENLWEVVAEFEKHRRSFSDEVTEFERKIQNLKDQERALLLKIQNLEKDLKSGKKGKKPNSEMLESSRILELELENERLEIELRDTKTELELLKAEQLKFSESS